MSNTVYSDTDELSERIRRYRRWAQAGLIVFLVVVPVGGALVTSALSDARIITPLRGALVTLIVALLGTCLHVGIAMPRLRRAALRGRSRLSPDEVYRRFDPHGARPQSMVVGLVAELESLYRVRSGSLRPWDRFTEDLCLLRPGWFFDFADRDRVHWAQRKLGPRGQLDDVARKETLGEFVEAVADSLHRGG